MMSVERFLLGFTISAILAIAIFWFIPELFSGPESGAMVAVLTGFMCGAVGLAIVHPYDAPRPIDTRDRCEDRCSMCRKYVPKRDRYGNPFARGMVCLKCLSAANILAERRP